MIIRATATLAIFALATSAAAGEPVAFPWGCKHNAATTVATSAPYQTLSKATKESPVQIPLQQLPPKIGYAYGWFGVNPNPSWGRHFGHAQGYTQWSSR
jgi:hypothetical protein